MLEIILEARNYAKMMHLGQKYGEHSYFEYHIQGVVANLLTHLENDTTMFSSKEMVALICTAYLHDVIEDTPVMYKDVLLKFGKRVANAVYVLTKWDEYDKSEDHLHAYLARIKDDPLARLVKISDIEFNANECRKEGKQDKYMYYIKQLKYLIAA